MKNITLFSVFVALAFSFLGTTAGAQTYVPAPGWNNKVSATVGNLTKVMSFDFGTQVYRRRVLVNPMLPFGMSNYGDYTTIADEVLIAGGPGFDTVSLDLEMSSNLGWRAWVVILDQDYNEVMPSVLLFNQTQPLAPLQIEFPDPYYGYDGSLASRSISYNPDVNSFFNPPDGEGYTNVFNVRLSCSDCPSNYNSLVSQPYTNVSAAQGFVAHFNLPQNLIGVWCLDAWVGVVHNSSQPFWSGEKIQWEFYPDCFYWDFSTSVGENEQASNVHAFPNPTLDGHVTVSSPEVTNYEISNSLGQKIASGQLMTGENQLDDFAGLPSGMYILHLDDGHFVRIQKQ